jgi:hypothetical protein
MGEMERSKRGSVGSSVGRADEEEEDDDDDDDDDDVSLSSDDVPLSNAVELSTTVPLSLR